jgi:endonuclease G
MKLIAIIFALFASVAQAACPQFFPHNHSIEVSHGIELCNSFYAVEYDTRLNAPILSAEKYEPGDHPERTNDFHPDLRLDAATRAENSDYAHSGYDKGHLTPAADAPTPTDMHDTFLLSNMTPQEPTLNRKAWRMLEIHVRMLSPDYVITGAIYPKHPEAIGTHAVPIPTRYYKIAWKNGKTYAWEAQNKNDAQVIESNIETIEHEAGLHFK